MPNPSIETTRMPGRARNRSTYAVASSRNGASAAPGQASQHREHQPEDEDQDLGEQEQLDVDPERPR